MRKVTIITLIVWMIFCISGCNWNPFVKQPFLYDNSVWKCKQPEISYFVKTRYDEEQKTDISDDYAATFIDGKKVVMDFGFLYNTIKVYELSDEDSKEFTGNTLFTGTCKYSKTKFTIKVDTETDNLFDGQYDELVFIRQEDKQAD
ncbi:MAG: hypothetical protein ACLR56_06460 [Oscillospiraceae bacterium]